MSKKPPLPEPPARTEPYYITDHSIISGRGRGSVEVYAGKFAPDLLREFLDEAVFGPRDALAARSIASREKIAAAAEALDEGRREYAAALDRAAIEGKPAPEDPTPALEDALADLQRVDERFLGLLFDEAQAVFAAITPENLDDAIAAGKAAQRVALEAMQAHVDELAAALVRHGEIGSEIRWCERLRHHGTAPAWVGASVELSRALSEAQSFVGRIGESVRAEIERLERGELEAPTGHLQRPTEGPIGRGTRPPRTTTKGEPQA